jgi:hypothetical protein
VNVKEWKGRYLYSDMHELFFTEFPCLLHEWLISERLKESLKKVQERWMLEEIPLWIKMLFIEKLMMCMDPDRMVE